MHPGYGGIGPLPGRDAASILLMENQLLEWKLELLLLEPAEVRPGSARPRGTGPATAGQEGPQMLLGLDLHRLQVSPRTSQVPHRLLIRSRYPCQGELTHAVQAYRGDRVATVRHYPIPGPAPRDQDVAAVRFVR